MKKQTKKSGMHIHFFGWINLALTQSGQSRPWPWQIQISTAWKMTQQDLWCPEPDKWSTDVISPCVLAMSSKPVVFLNIICKALRTAVDSTGRFLLCILRDPHMVSFMAVLNIGILQMGILRCFNILEVCVMTSWQTQCSHGYKNMIILINTFGNS